VITTCRPEKQSDGPGGEPPRCSAEGALLTLLDCDRKRLTEVARETGGVAADADVTQEVSVARAAGRNRAMGGIDGVVNAAGIVIHGSVLDVGVADWKLVLDVNLTGTYIVVRCCMPWLAKAPFATIVNIASGQGLLPNTPNMTAYAASKRGVVNLTRALLTAIGFMLGPLIGHLFIGHTQ
jgi:NAD(P)-dependent dehydrogenase (short-subunit alcohol dehydrogenase family)